MYPVTYCETQHCDTEQAHANHNWDRKPQSKLHDAMCNRIIDWQAHSDENNSDLQHTCDRERQTKGNAPP
jgi:hypothetical protein